jgi:hypothetical protein
VLADVGLVGGVDDGDAATERRRAPLAADEELPLRDRRRRGHRSGVGGRALSLGFGWWGSARRCAQGVSVDWKGKHAISVFVVRRRPRLSLRARLWIATWPFGCTLLETLTEETMDSPVTKKTKKDFKREKKKRDSPLRQRKVNTPAAAPQKQTSKWGPGSSLRIAHVVGGTIRSTYMKLPRFSLVCTSPHVAQDTLGLW